MPSLRRGLRPESISADAKPWDLRSMRGVMGKKLLGTAAGIMLALLCFAGTASAETKTLRTTQTYAPLVQQMSGVADEQLVLEDDANEWQTVTQSANSADILGFTCAFDVSVGDSCYHRVYVAPIVTQQLYGSVPLSASARYQPIWSRLEDGTQDPYYGAIAILTLIHESYHNRLRSADESLVNTCALRDFGYWLSTAFQVPRTVTTTTYTYSRHAYRKRIRVNHHRRVKGRMRSWHTDKRVIRYHTVTVPQSIDSPNPLYTTLVNDAQSFYASQPPPYNAGTCTAAPVS